MAGAAEEVLHEGEMTKKAIGKSKRPHINWRTRWFRLTADELVYFQKNTTKVPSGAIDLNTVTVIERVDMTAFNNRPHLIQINFVDRGVDRVLYTQCKTRGAADKWLRELRCLFPRKGPDCVPMREKYHSGTESEPNVWTCCRATHPEGCCTPYWVEHSAGPDVDDVPTYEEPVSVKPSADSDDGEDKDPNPYDNDAEFKQAIGEGEGEGEDGHYEEALDDHEMYTAEEIKAGKNGDGQIANFQPEESKSPPGTYVNVLELGAVGSEQQKSGDYDTVVPTPASEPTAVKSTPTPRPRPNSASQTSLTETSRPTIAEFVADSDPSDDETPSIKTVPAYENVDVVLEEAEARARFRSYENVIPPSAQSRAAQAAPPQ